MTKSSLLTSNMLQNILKRENDEVLKNYSNKYETIWGNSLFNGKKLNKSTISYLPTNPTNTYAIIDKQDQYKKCFKTINLPNKSFCSEISKNDDKIKLQNNQIIIKQTINGKDSSKNSKNILIEHSKNAKLINYVAVLNSPKFKVVINLGYCLSWK